MRALSFAVLLGLLGVVSCDSFSTGGFVATDSFYNRTPMLDLRPVNLQLTFDL